MIGREIFERLFDLPPRSSRLKTTPQLMTLFDFLTSYSQEDSLTIEKGIRGDKIVSIFDGGFALPLRLAGLMTRFYWTVLRIKN